MTRYDAIEKWRQSRKPTVADSAAVKAVSQPSVEEVHVMVTIWDGGLEVGVSVFATQDALANEVKAYLSERNENGLWGMTADTIDATVSALLLYGRYDCPDGSCLTYAENKVIGGDDK